MMRIGIDLGGTKIEAIALATDGAIKAHRRMPAPQGSYPATIRALHDLVESIETQTGTRGSVGIGTPGAMSPATGLIKNANSTWLNGKPFDRDLAAALERPVRLANDANCFALSEAIDGAGAGAHTVFGVILGTGVGGGIVIDGQPLIGRNAIAGEWGHNPLPWPDAEERAHAAPCYCGKSGCIETYLSGSGLSRDHSAAAAVPMAAHDIAEAARRGEPLACAAFARYERRLAKALAHVVNLIDPDVIVLGGGLSNWHGLYESVPRHWANHVFSDQVATPIRPNKWGDASGVRGAAWLWQRDIAE